MVKLFFTSRAVWFGSIIAAACWISAAAVLATPAIVWVDPPHRPFPGVQHHTFDSRAIGKPVGYRIYCHPNMKGDLNADFPWSTGFMAAEAARAATAFPRL